jgi:hypothetical protein
MFSRASIVNASFDDHRGDAIQTTASGFNDRRDNVVESFCELDSKAGGN